MPTRIQRKRTKGWEMPDNAVYVGRPTLWGNPFKIGETYRSPINKTGDFVITATNCLELYETYLVGALTQDPNWLVPLRGKDLACWCRTDRPCHADILLRIANEAEP